MAGSVGGIDYSYPVLYQSPQSGGVQGQTPRSADSASAAQSAQGANPGTNQPGGTEKSSQDQQKIADLKKRDQEVRVHEQAHIAAGGQYVRGGATYKFTAGPDGRQYATSGEVSVDTSPVPNDPDATIRKMQTVKSAALAPETPSSKDYSVAASATNEIAKATQEKMKKLLAKMGVTTGGATGSYGADSTSSKGTGIDITV